MTAEQKTESISYSELARRVGDCILNNDIHGVLVAEDLDVETINGDTLYCYEHETKEECKKNDYVDCKHESIDVYQEYIITESGAEYLQRVSDEIVYYCEPAGLYLWGITHFGTGWDCVFTQIKAN